MVIHNEYTDGWIQTFSGKKFHFLKPSITEVDIADIAHALSMLCRFRGHTREFYSVAQHSWEVAALVPKRLRLAALLHDAAEAYIGDMCSPLKHHMPEFAQLEDKIRAVIFQKYLVYLPEEEEHIVKSADRVMRATEARDLIGSTEGWKKLPKPRLETIKCCPPSLAEAYFMKRFQEEAQ